MQKGGYVLLMDENILECIDEMIEHVKDNYISTTVTSLKKIVDNIGELDEDYACFIVGVDWHDICTDSAELSNLWDAYLESMEISDEDIDPDLVTKYDIVLQEKLENLIEELS